MTATDTVHDRIDRAGESLTPTQMALGLLLVAAAGFGLLFLHEPAMHAAVHDFRHGAGVVCH